MSLKKLLGIFLFCTALNFTLFAWGADKNVEKDSLQYQWEQFSASLGGFLTYINSDLTILGQEMGAGLSVDLEDAFGLSTTKLALRSELEYNFGSKRRSNVRLGYFFLLRNSAKKLESEIRLGDHVYPIGTEISSKMDLHIIRFLYDYSIFRDERVNLGLSGGLYFLPLSYSIGAYKVIDEADSFILPLPVLGIRLTVRLSPKFSIRESWELLFARTSNYRGNINDINTWFEYHPSSHLGIGLGFNLFRLSMSATEEFWARDFVGTFKTGFTGLLLFGKYYF